jgi:hypothetical protein
VAVCVVGKGSERTILPATDAPDAPDAPDAEEPVDRADALDPQVHVFAGGAAFSELQQLNAAVVKAAVLRTARSASWAIAALQSCRWGHGSPTSMGWTVSRVWLQQLIIAPRSSGRR